MRALICFIVLALLLSLVGCAHNDGGDRKVTWDGLNVKVETTYHIKGDDNRSQEQKIINSRPGCEFCYLDHRFEKGLAVEHLLRELPPGRYANPKFVNTQEGTYVYALLVTKKRLRELGPDEFAPVGVWMRIDGHKRYVADE